MRRTTVFATVLLIAAVYFAIAAIGGSELSAFAAIVFAYTAGRCK